MPISFPEHARLEVPLVLSNQLLKGAECLPRYDNKDFYSPALQIKVSDGVRESCIDGFDWLIDSIKDRTSQWPFCTLVSGVRFDDGNKLFVAINRAFGELVARPYEKPRAQLVHYVQPTSDLPSVRGGRESERLHTDTADWDTPVELISMACVRPDPAGGGRSRILDVGAVRDEVEFHLGTQTLEMLESEPVPWQLAAYCGGGVKWRPVLGKSQICWRRYTIELAIDSNGTKLSPEMLKALTAFEEVIEATNRTVDFLMREQDFLISDNHRTVHARTPVSAKGFDRLMIRSWIRTSGTN